MFKSGMLKDESKEPETNVAFDAAKVTPAQSSANIVGVNFRVGKKIGEGSFGILYEGTHLRIYVYSRFAF